MTEAAEELFGDDSSKSEFNFFKECRPFVKWVGGKGQLLDELIDRLPQDYNCYFEPFVGGGALFFELTPNRAYLSDLNHELINTYQVIRDNPKKLIEYLKQHYYEKDYYYLIRNIDRTVEYNDWPNEKRAARMIYLNRCGFNGLYRVNSKGQFNTPFGRYTNPKIVDEENIISCSLALRNADIKVASFESVESIAKAGDFVYFDPPYVPLSATSKFTNYNSNAFDLKMQEELFKVCRSLNSKGVYFMLSNSSAPYVLELYRDFKIDIVQAVRAINSVATKRGAVDEVIVRNY